MARPRASTRCSFCAGLALHFTAVVSIQEGGRKLLCCPACARDFLSRLSSSDGEAEAQLEAAWRLPAHRIDVIEGDMGADAP